MAKILGIDYGEKRIGLAISDESATFSRELAIWPPKEFWQRIKQLVLEEEIETVVVGWPISLAGKETLKTREVGAFKSRLQEILPVPVAAADERLSSAMAMKLPGGRKDIDSLAAQILLQNYLDIHNREKSPTA